MTARYQERHQDYVLGPNQFSSLASVAANGPLVKIPFKLDPDAPFLLRSIAVRRAYTSAEDPEQTGLNGLLFRFSGPNENFFFQQPVRWSTLAPYYGQAGNSHPWYPQVIYPAGGSINVEYQNTGASTLTNLTFYFRGVKLYPNGSMAQYSYPATFATLPFTCPRTYDNLPVTTPTNGLRSIFRPPQDADFVLRGMQAGPTFSRSSYEVFIRLLDENEKPFSNDAVHVDVLAGRSLMPAAYPSGTSMLAPTGTGASQPGLFYPEIYVPKQHILYYDLIRTDVGYAGAAVEDFPIQFQGMKVFPK